MAAGCSTSSALKKSYRGNLDSKVLSSSLGNRPFSTKVCDRLDTETKSACRPIPKRIAMESQLSFQASSCMAEVQLKVTDEANLRKNKVGLNDSNESAFLPDGSEVKEKFNSSGGESSAAHDSDVKICIGNGFEVKDKFNSSGGELNAAHDSDVKICIGNGAIPTGVSQEVFYRVVYDTTELLRNIPVGPDETLISPVIECGPHDIRLLKPLKIIIPHCLYMGKAKKEWITVYRTDPGRTNVPIRWEKIPNESKKNDMSRAWFTAKEDSIHIKTMTFCFWCVYCRRGAPRKKRATVFASKPNPRRDLIFFRFYIYSDNKDSMRRVKTQDREQFPDSWKGMEKPFKMYNNSKRITVKLMVDPEKGWELDDTPGEQVYICDDSHGGRFRYKDACAFAVKPVKGREVEEFSCSLSFQQEGHDTEHAIYLNPGFSLVEKSVEPANACTHFNSAAGCSTSSAPAESDRRSSDEQPKTPRDSKLLSSLLDNRSFLKKVCDRLDREMKNYGDYRDVCSHYGFDRYEVAANFAKHDAGPSTALLEYLAVKYPKLTVDEFASVLKNVTQRNDVVESLEEYDNE